MIINLFSTLHSLIDNKDLSDCYPLLPKHLNVYPKKGEWVYILTLNKNSNQQLRYFLGPVIDTFEHLSKNDKQKLVRKKIEDMLEQKKLRREVDDYEEEIFKEYQWKNDK